MPMSMPEIDMGNVEPFGAALQPNIYANPTMANAFAPYGAGTGAGPSMPTATMAPQAIMAMMGYVQHILSPVVDAVNRLTQQQQCITGQPHAAIMEPIAQGNRNSHSQPTDPPSTKASSSAKKSHFPHLSSFKTVEEMAMWYSTRPLPCGNTPMELEDSEQHDWRGGKRFKHQRWSEYEVLIKHIKATQLQLIRDNSKIVSFVEAAQQCDKERESLHTRHTGSKKALTVCQFMEYLAKASKSKGGSA